MKRGLLYRLKQVPHLFSKVVVLYCVAVASGTSTASVIGCSPLRLSSCHTPPG